MNFNRSVRLTLGIVLLSLLSVPVDSLAQSTLDALKAIANELVTKQPVTTADVPPSDPATSSTSTTAPSNGTLSGVQGLSGLEASMVLGHTTEWDREAAILKMVANNTIRNGLSADEAVLILANMSGSARAKGIADIVKIIQQGLTAQQAATVLGTVQQLNEWDRRVAEKALIDAQRLGATGADTSLILQGMTGQAREASISDLAGGMKDGLSGKEASEILGTAASLNEWDRVHAIQALVKVGKLTNNLTGSDYVAILDGTTGSARAQAISYLSKGDADPCNSSNTISMNPSWHYVFAEKADPPISNLWGYDDSKPNGSKLVQNATSYFKPVDHMDVVIGCEKKRLYAFPDVDGLGKYDVDGTFQCTALISQYLSLLGFVNAPTEIGNGRDVVTNLTTGPNASFFSPIDPSKPPQVGSIISMDAGPSVVAHQHGHVAIVKRVYKVNDSKITVILIEQNIGKDTGEISVCRTIDFTKANGIWSAKHFILKGSSNDYAVLNWTTPIYSPVPIKYTQ